MKSRADQIFERFVRFHRANPHFWHLFCQFADDMRQVKPHYSSKSIFERARWEVDLTTAITDDDSVKLNNDFTAYYARMYLVVRLKAKAKGFFELRKRTSEKRSAYKIDMTSYHTGSATNEDDLTESLIDLATEEE